MKKMVICCVALVLFVIALAFVCYSKQKENFILRQTIDDAVVFETKQPILDYFASDLVHQQEENKKQLSEKFHDSISSVVFRYSIRLDKTSLLLLDENNELVEKYENRVLVFTRRKRTMPW